MSLSDVRPFQLCYVSELVPGTGKQAVSDIALVSWPRNLAVGISGALLFDGERFCQLLEGSEPEVRRLMTRIGLDSRHRELTVTAAGHFGLPRLTSCWRFGQCSRLALDPLVARPLAQEEVALAMFMSALTTATVA